jgi:hypothetical protein
MRLIRLGVVVDYLGVAFGNRSRHPRMDWESALINWELFEMLCTIVRCPELQRRSRYGRLRESLFMA